MPEMTPKKKWIWQQNAWPALTWDSDTLATRLREVTQLQGTLLGKAGATANATNAE